MATPITPKYFADTVVLGNVSINYRPVWDGVSWVVTPAEIKVVGIGHLTEGGNSTTQADITMPATDLPQGGQDALQQLLQFIEGELATKYS